MPVIDFPEYAPDVTDIGTNVSPLISGVFPRADGYGPTKALQAFTQSLPGACRGAFFARRTDGSIAVFAGTSTDLYLLNNTDFSWTLVSKGGVSYSALPSGDNWQFIQFNDTVLATQINTVVQSYVLSSSSAFSDLAGSPPQARHIAVIGGFVVLSGLASAPKRVQWSDLFNIAAWTSGVGLSDFQDLADGGSVHGVSGGDYYGVIFQDEKIRRMLYVPGSAAIFDIVVISTNETLFGQYSFTSVSDRTFFCSSQGFRMILSSNGVPEPIGKERIDRTFFSDIDIANLQLFIVCVDPGATRVMWAYKSTQGMQGLFDKLLVYDWSIGKNGRWSIVPCSGEFLSSIAKPGLTLEDLDNIAPGGSLDALGFSLDSVSVAAYSQLAAFNSSHSAGFFDGNNIEAIIETGEMDNDGDMTFVSSVRPITDCADGLVSIAYRNVPQSASTYSSETPIDTAQGQAPCLVEARYIRGRLRCPAGSEWSYAKGLQPEVQDAGEM
jgi:hypothetical protein